MCVLAGFSAPYRAEQDRATDQSKINDQTRPENSLYFSLKKLRPLHLDICRT
jgi:hypothetical protein